MDCGIPFCQTRLPGQQHHSGLERPRLPAPVAAARSTCCTRPTTFPSSPAACARRRARRRARSTSTTIRSASSRSSTSSSTRAGKRAGSCRSRRERKTGKRVAVVGSGPGGHGLRAAARARRARRRALREGRPHRRPAALRHSRLQDGEAPDRPAHGADGAEGVEFRPNVARRRRRRRRRQLLERVRRDRADRRRRSSRATCRCRAASSTASISRWSSCRSRTRSSRATTCADQIMATGKHVVVIGGGDTGSDCVGTSNRQGATSITQFELLPQPPEQENKPLTWPYWPIKLRTSSSHEEGCRPRLGGRDQALRRPQRQGREARRGARRMAARTATAQMKMVEVPGQRVRDQGRSRAARDGLHRPGASTGLLEQLGVERDARGNVTGEHRRLPHVGAEGVRGRRHAPRPVARRVGDPRRPPVRARGRRVPDGQRRAAALNRARGPRSIAAHGLAGCVPATCMLLPLRSRDADTRKRHLPARAAARAHAVHAGVADAPGGPLPARVQRDARDAPAASSRSRRIPALATEVTLQPLARFPLDAAILFSDILTVPDAMGLGLSFAEGEGPRFERTAADEARSRALEVPDMAKLRYVFDAVATIKRALAGRVPLIGFAGSPFTLACYMIEGGGSADFATRAAHGVRAARPAGSGSSTSMRARSPAYLDEQIARGRRRGDALRHVGRPALRPTPTARFSLAPMRAVLAALRAGADGAPCRRSCSPRAAAQWLDELAACGAHVRRARLDASTSRPRAARVGARVALQGNLDPLVLLDRSRRRSRAKPRHRSRGGPRARPRLQPRPRHRSGHAAGERRGAGRGRASRIARSRAGA